MTFRENAALSDSFVNDWQWILFANNELDTDQHARRANGHVKRKSFLVSIFFSSCFDVWKFKKFYVKSNLNKLRVSKTGILTVKLGFNSEFGNN